MLHHLGTTKLSTKRLTLRRFLLSDAKTMYRNYANDGRVTRFLSWQPYADVAGVAAFLAALIERYEREDVYHWAIEFEGEVVGSISVISFSERNASCEIGYCIGYDVWNKGIMSEAVTAVMGFLFGEVHMRRISAKHDVENPASGKVMEKCGMACEGRLRQYYLRHDGTASDALAYGILKDEFTQKQQPR